MGIEEGLFESSDGTRLFCRFQAGSPEKNPLIILHGHGEHSGRYLKFFSNLGDLQIPIGIFDLRGCGRSGGPRASVGQFEDYLGDVSSLLQFLTSHFQVKTPVQLLGHSLGGLIALAWARENPKLVSKLILSSPLLGLPRENLSRWAAAFLNRILPSLMIKNPVPPPFLTHDPVEVENYRRDPLIQRKITIRLVNEMLRYAFLFREGEIPLSFPVYLLMAEKEFVVDPAATRNFYSRLRSPHKELEVFTGYYHEIFNEVGQAKVFERLRHYLTHS